MDGSHGIARCELVTEQVFGWQFLRNWLRIALALGGMLLKPDMAIAGMKWAQQDTAQAVAEATIRCLTRHVPAAVPGMVFLSGGQSVQLAVVSLDAMNESGAYPWEVSFSYGRAYVQAPVLAAWKGQEANVAAAQAALLRRCRFNGLARKGIYTSAMEAD